MLSGKRTEPSMARTLWPTASSPSKKSMEGAHPPHKGALLKIHKLMQFVSLIIFIDSSLMQIDYSI